MNQLIIAKLINMQASHIPPCIQRESKNLWDITKVDTSLLPNDIDLITYGFPCQDISISGLQKGFEHDGERTRSGLFFEALRIIEDTKPDVAIAENVKNLVSKKFTKEFNIVLKSLENAGYNNYCQVLNAKDYGIPHNRERVFIVSIRKDIDKYDLLNRFPFPAKQKLNLRLKDMLEKEVNEKYYINKALNMKITDKYIQYDNSSKGYNSQAMRLYFQDGLCPAQPANNGGDKTQVILMDKNDFIREWKVYQNEVLSKIHKRRLTPKECWRLMGFTDEEFERAKNTGMSNTQLYKQAGNSIVVNVLVEIFRNLYINGDLYEQD